MLERLLQRMQKDQVSFVVPGSYFSHCRQACTWITKAERYLPFKAFKAVKVCGSCSPWHAEHILAMNDCFGRIWPTHTSVSGITRNRRKALRGPPLPRTRRPPAFHVGKPGRWRKDGRLWSVASQGARGDMGVKRRHSKHENQMTEIQKSRLQHRNLWCNVPWERGVKKVAEGFDACILSQAG